MKDYNKYKLVIVTLVIELHYFIVSEIPQRLKEPLESSNYPEKMASKFLPFISKVNKSVSQQAKNGSNLYFSDSC